MPAAEPQSEVDKLREFELRMQTEGAAGFADGPEPWNAWPETSYDGGKQSWESKPREETAAVPDKTQCEKLLSSVAAVAVVALATGIGGVYLSTDTTPMIAGNDLQPAPVSTPAAQEPELSLSGSVLRGTAVTSAALPAADPVASPAAEPFTGEPANQLNDAPAVAGTQPEVAGTETVSADVVENNGAMPAPATVTATASDSGNSIAESLPAPAAGKPAKVAMITPPAPAAASQPTVQEAVTQAAAGDGIWVVNISSYNFESMARRKLGEFKKKGVTAEVFPTTVKGRQIYRIRTTGYETRAEANTWVSLLEDRLGVDSAWVSKR